MARTDTLENFLTDTADAIREAGGTEEAISPASFDEAIMALAASGGGSGWDYYDDIPSDCHSGYYGDYFMATDSLVKGIYNASNIGYIAANNWPTLPSVMFVTKDFKDTDEGGVFAFGFAISNSVNDRYWLMYLLKKQTGNKATGGQLLNYTATTKSMSNILLKNYDQVISGMFKYNTLPETSNTPTKDTHFVNKKYVDDTVANAGSGVTLIEPMYRTEEANGVAYKIISDNVIFEDRGDYYYLAGSLIYQSLGTELKAINLFSVSKLGLDYTMTEHPLFARIHRATMDTPSSFPGAFGTGVSRVDSYFQIDTCQTDGRTVMCIIEPLVIYKHQE